MADAWTLLTDNSTSLAGDAWTRLTTLSCSGTGDDAYEILVANSSTVGDAWSMLSDLQVCGGEFVLGVCVFVRSSLTRVFVRGTTP